MKKLLLLLLMISCAYGQDVTGYDGERWGPMWPPESEPKWDVTGDKAAQDEAISRAKDFASLNNQTLFDQLEIDIGAIVTVMHGLYTKEDCEEIVKLLGQFMVAADSGLPMPTREEIEALRDKWVKRARELDQP